MKKTKLSIVLTGVVLSTSLYAAPKQQTQQISWGVPNSQSLEARITELEERVDENEFQAAMDKIKFGLDFSTGLNFTNIKYGTMLPTGNVDNANKTKYSSNNKWSNELHLNMNANINDNVSFYGRLSMAKGWGQMRNEDPNWMKPYDTDAGRNTRWSGSSLYVSRAYVDYTIIPGIILTIGRQPGTDGPGTNLRNNALRQSTYPALMINTLGDAAVFTFKPMDGFALRAGYGKTYQFDEESGEVRDWMAQNPDGVADSDLYYANAEYSMDNFLLMFNYAKLQNFSLPITGSNPALGGAFDFGVQNLGNIDLVEFSLEAYNLFNSGLNYTGSIGYYRGSGAKQLTGRVTLPNGTVAPITLPQTLNTEDAYSVHVGLRYDFTQSFKLGAEYFYGSRYWYTLSRPSFNDPLNLRQTRGNAFDVYGIYQVDRNQYFRLSYTRIDNQWSNRGTPIGGAASKSNIKTPVSMADNIMLMYNVRY